MAAAIFVWQNQNRQLQVEASNALAKGEGAFQLRLRWRFGRDFEEVQAGDITPIEFVHIPDEFKWSQASIGDNKEAVIVIVTNDQFLIKCQFCEDIYRLHKSDMGVHFRSRHVPTLFFDEHTYVNSQPHLLFY